MEDNYFSEIPDALLWLRIVRIIIYMVQFWKLCILSSVALLKLISRGVK